MEILFQDILTNLSFDWYQNLNKEFQAHPFYNKNTQMIDFLDEGWEHYYDPALDDYEVSWYERPHKYTLIEYSWNGYNQPAGWHQHIHLIPKGKDYFTRFSERVRFPSKKVSDVSQKNKIIRDALSEMNLTFKQLNSGKEDSIYLDVLDFLKQKYESEVNARASHINALNNKFSTGDNVYFNLNEKQLTALMTLLIKAGIIEGEEDDFYSFKLFCDRYFYYDYSQSKKKSKTLIKGKYAQAEIRHDITAALKNGNINYVNNIQQVYQKIS